MKILVWAILDRKITQMGLVRGARCGCVRPFGRYILPDGCSIRMICLNLLPDSRPVQAAGLQEDQRKTVHVVNISLGGPLSEFKSSIATMRLETISKLDIW
jgi:hypothetical protein